MRVKKNDEALPEKAVMPLSFAWLALAGALPYPRYIMLGYVLGSRCPERIGILGRFRELLSDAVILVHMCLETVRHHHFPAVHARYHQTMPFLKHKSTLIYIISCSVFSIKITVFLSQLHTHCKIKEISQLSCQ